MSEPLNITCYICQQCVSLNAVCSTWEGGSSRFHRVSPTMPADVSKLCAVFHVVITSKRTENRFCMHCNSAILGIEQPAKSVGYSHTNTSFPLHIISLHRLECQRRTYSTRRRWLENDSAVSKQPLQTTQIMNINNITRVYAKITGGGGIPPLAAHADTTHMPTSAATCTTIQ